MNQFSIETHALTKAFDSRTAVDRLSLQVQPGDVFGFLGQNGAGKSTTIRMLLGLVKPSSGHVSLLGHDLPRHRERAFRNARLPSLSRQPKHGDRGQRVNRGKSSGVIQGRTV